MLDIVFLYYFGLIGIAYATVLSYFFEKAVEIAYLKRIGYGINDYVPTNAWLLYSIATLIAWLCTSLWTI